jgi:hypothetical protein
LYGDGLVGDPKMDRAAPRRLSNSALDGFHAIAQVSKIVERLDFHRLRRLRNFDDKDLVFVLFHSLVDVCEMNEVIFRDQGIIGFIFVVDGN